MRAATRGLRLKFSRICVAVGIVCFFATAGFSQEATSNEGASADQAAEVAAERPIVVIVPEVERRIGAIEALLKDYTAGVTAERSASPGEHDLRDLVAQEAMAKWAFWMLVASVLSIITGSVGIFLVWRTLLHTKRSSDYAQEMLQSERAWLLFDHGTAVPFGSEDDNEKRVAVAFEVNIVNFGRSPASEMEIHLKMHLESSLEEVGLEEADSISDRLPDGTVGPGGVFSVKSASLTLDEADKIRDGNLICVLHCTAKYKDIFRKARKTEFSVAVTPNLTRDVLEEDEFDGSASFSFRNFPSGRNMAS